MANKNETPYPDSLALEYIIDVAHLIHILGVQEANIDRLLGYTPHTDNVDNCMANRCIEAREAKKEIENAFSKLLDWRLNDRR